jgi:hypothetical protein
VKLTDFLGKEYGPGDLVIYGAMSGRSVNVVVGRVVDIYEVYRDPDKYKWVRVPDSGEVPVKRYGKDAGQPEDTYLRVKVQPIRGARWKQHHGRTRYIDTRTGKGIDPDRGKGFPHILKSSHFVFADGAEYDYEGEKAAWEANRVGQWREHSDFDRQFRKRFHINYGEVGQHRFPLTHDVEDKLQLWWVSRTYQPWVQKINNGPEPVTLDITDNIVKWEGELPDAEVPVPLP